MTAEPLGPYLPESLLGRGSMGEVWRALDTRRDRRVALKILTRWLSRDAEFAQRFRQEVAQAAKLSGPHIVPIHDYGEIDGHLYVDMQLVDGTDLATMLECSGPLSPERAVEIIAQVADALDLAHRRGAIHRDVKPSNILVRDNGGGSEFAYLFDFGLAHAVEGRRISLSGTLIGSPAYMAPERFDGDGDHRSDVYALACVLYEALTGRQPFPDRSPWGLYNAHHTSPPPLPSAHRPDLPPGLDVAIARGLAKDPEERFPVAGDLASAARAALAGSDTAMATTLLDRPAGDGPQLRGIKVGVSPAVRRRQYWLGAAVVACILASVSVVVVLNGERGTIGPPLRSPPAQVALVAVGGEPLTPVLTPDGKKAYVANRGSGTVSVIDTARLAVTALIQITTESAVTTFAGMSPDGRFLYVDSTDDIKVIDTISDTIVARLPLGGNSVELFTPDGLAYGTGYNGVVTSFEVASNRVVASVNVGEQADGAILGPDNDVYVSTENAVVALDRAAGAVNATIPIGDSPAGPVPIPGRRVLYVRCEASDSISVVDVDRELLTTTITTGDMPTDMKLSPNGRTAYVVNRGGTLSVVDTGTDRVVTDVPLGGTPSHAVIAPNGAFIYVVGVAGATFGADQGRGLFELGSLWVVRTSDNTVTARLPLGSYAFSPVISRDGRTVVVSNNMSDSLSVVDTAEQRVVGTVPVGRAPNSAVITSDGTRAFVPSIGTSTVAVVDLGTGSVRGDG